MKRLEALRVVDEAFADRPLVVTCGAPARELASISRRDSHLYLLDSMGLAAAVGVGLALAGHGPLAALEGDGSLLMGFSVLPTIRSLAPPGFTLVVLDNHEHASAGRVPTQSVHVDLAAASRGVGLDTREASDAEALWAALRRGRETGEPTVVVATIEPGNTPGIPLLLEDPVAIRTRFSAFLARTASGGRASGATAGGADGRRGGVKGAR